MVRYTRVVVSMTVLLAIHVPPALSTAIYDLPGFVGIIACFVRGPGSTECDGLTRDQLLAQPDSIIPIASPGTGGILTGGLGGQNGDLGNGDEFFVLSLTPTAASRFLLDSVVIQFDATQPVRLEFASAITATAGLTFASGFGPEDLSRALGPTDGNYVELIGGTLVFGFASSTPSQLASLSPAMLWIGLKNSDDQGTAFDLQAEVSINSAMVATARTRCIMGVTRNPDKAKEAMVVFGPIQPASFAPGDVLSLKILTRIGTTPDGTKCPGHSNAVGLRLYYDAINRPSRVGAELSPDLLNDFFLHSSGSDFLDDTAPTATTAKFKDSVGLNFAGGNPWKAIGTWSMTLP